MPNLLHITPTIYLGNPFTKRTDYDYGYMKYPGHHNYQTLLLCLHY